ncbi:DUF2306 domain-containing protein [Paenibacillus sp. PL2-23]|uniref:DUF2306 domain-containing protein n=1 Tax=Paenibacillus sp. PL2-23 TaxID=2100729 RepID=UPI0030F72525
MQKKLWIAMTVLAILVSGYAVVQYYVLDAEKAGFVLQKLEAQQLERIWYGMLYAHIAGSVTALLLGSINMLKSVRERRPKLHRIMGRVYMAGIVLGGLSGAYLAFQATGGAVSTAGFLVLSIVWLLSGFWAVKTIRAKQAAQHRRWMIRNYALTLAAVSLRLWLALFVLAFGEENFVTSYTIISWLSWVPNALAAEWYIRRWGRGSSVPVGA